MKRRFVIAILIVVLFTGMNVGPDRSQLGVRAIAEAATSVSVESEKELIKALHTALLNRQEAITVKYTLPDYELDFSKLFDKVLSVDSKKTAKDGDYLDFSLSAWNAEGKMIGRDTTLYIKFKYKTTLKEEQTVDKKVKSVLQSLELKEASDYEKAKEIHDYIINLVSYDSELTKSSAYNALMDQSAVCEGYSMLAYRMFTEAGLEARIISGTGNGTPHAWNIVKINGKWYNIDLTWDDPISSDGTPMLVYDYFLKNTKDFTGHRRYAEYKTDQFVKTYPISKTSYKME